MRKAVIALLSLFVVNILACSSVRADGLGGSATATVPIPSDLQGVHSIHVPELQGVEQILVLSDRWVIVVSNKRRELFDEINARSAGTLIRSVNAWERSVERKRPDWRALKSIGRIRDQFLASARQALGELRFGRTDFFKIQSAGDVNYKIPVHPTRADRLLVSAGQSRSNAGALGIDYHIYSYLELPVPMQSGRRYDLTLGDGAHDLDVLRF